MSEGLVVFMHFISNLLFQHLVDMATICALVGAMLGGERGNFEVILF